MIKNDQYLRPMLDAGSSRVFNCNDRMRKLVAEQVPSPFFFKMPKMHGLILIKEAILDHLRRGPDDPVVGMKLYFPYNQEDVYEGGRSVYFHESNLSLVLNEQFGLKGVEANDDLRHDMRMLEILDGLPSLDGFLMRDQLEIAGLPANDNYFEVSGPERLAIQQFVRRKFEPLVRAAFGGDAAHANQVAQLIDKIWEAKDMVALAPLIEAFRFPESEALAIFSSWKGINYYIFEYARTKKQREQLGLWLRDFAKPRDLIAKGDHERLNKLRRGTIDRLRHHWNAVESITQEYDALYAKFLNSTEGVGEFVNFLRRSSETYWRMGEALSKIDHAVHCWKTMTAPYSDKMLPAVKLGALLDMMQLVLAGGERKTTAMVWK